MTFASALEFLDFGHPDVPGCLVLDIKMPSLIGLELQDRMAEKGISIPIIFITGHGTVPDSVRAMKAPPSAPGREANEHPPLQAGYADPPGMRGFQACGQRDAQQAGRL